MAQLKDTTIDGDLIVNGKLYVNGLNKSYNLSYPTDKFSTSQCLCQRSGNICHVYVSLKTSTSINANTEIVLTGHPITPVAQYYRLTSYGNSDVWVSVSSEAITFNHVNAINSGSWVRFNFSYVCTD